MKTTSKLAGYALAVAAAGLFGTAPAFAGDKAADKAEVKCDNSTSCKGHGACKAGKNECKGKNGCKGMGTTMQKDEAACKAAQEAAKKA